jgi:hypothetical protein
MRFTVTRRRRRIIGLALATCSLAVAAPAVAGGTSDTASTDLRSPDARAAALAAEQPAATTDLRSPDARDAALAAEQPPASVDLRSPDARDAGQPASSGSPSTSTSVAPVQPTVVPVVEENGSQTLAIVFSSTALFIALVAFGFAAIYRRPRPRWSAP